MLIFYGFPDWDMAGRFVDRVEELYGLQVTIHDSQEETDLIESFPEILTPPIVLVERGAGMVVEGRVQELVTEFGGTFAGT